MKTILSDEFISKMAAKKTCEAGDFETFVAKAAKQEIARNEASKLFDHWRGHRVPREHMLNSAAWVVRKDEILFNESSPGRHMTAYYREKIMNTKTETMKEAEKEAYRNYINAKRAYDQNPTPANYDEMVKAQSEYHQARAAHE